MKKLALIDIDGVIADERHRTHYAEDKEWDKYFSPNRVGKDGVWVEGTELVSNLQEDGWDIAYLTGRREEIREATQSWLEEHNFPVGDLIMRPLPNDEPKVPLANFKVNTMLALPTLWDDVVLYDDDPEVIRLVKEKVGVNSAVHCTWHKKSEKLITEATA